MTAKTTRPQGPDGALWEPARHLLESLEQAVAGGWYPARRELLSRLAEAPAPGLATWVPEADVEETPREIVVSLALPGVEKADIRVESTEDVLTVSGRRQEPERPLDAGRREQPRGRFLRRVTLPAEVKPESAKASYRNGVLVVTLPRARAALGRAIKIE